MYIYIYIYIYIYVCIYTYVYIIYIYIYIYIIYMAVCCHIVWNRLVIIIINIIILIIFYMKQTDTNYNKDYNFFLRKNWVEQLCPVSFCTSSTSFFSVAKPVPRPKLQIPLINRVAKNEIMVLGFLTEKNLNFTDAPDMIHLVKSLAKDNERRVKHR